jgi:hypothetical protein
MVRTRLENVVLKVKVLGCTRLSEFLNQLLDPPSQLAVDLAVQALKDIGALDLDGKLLKSWRMLYQKYCLYFYRPEPTSQDAKPRVQPGVQPPFIYQMWGGMNPGLNPRFDLLRCGPWQRLGRSSQFCCQFHLESYRYRI